MAKDIIFDTDKLAAGVDKLANAVNQHLPKDIHVLSTEEVPMEFHARKSALGKHYQYRVWNSDDTTVFGNQYFYPISHWFSLLLYSTILYLVSIFYHIRLKITIYFQMKYCTKYFVSYW